MLFYENISVIKSFQLEGTFKGHVVQLLQNDQGQLLLGLPDK